MKFNIIFWLSRFDRMSNKFGIFIRDIRRSFDWHLLGGKRYFSRYGTEIISSHKWVFIVGCNNSGTSILQNLLGASGEVSTLPFEGQMYTRIFSRARKRKYERVWVEYLDDFKQLPGNIDTARLRLVFDWVRDLEMPLNEVILEKTPANAIRMQWLQKAFPNSYFIGLVRDGYAVTEGIMRKGEKSAERGALHWNEVNRLMLEESKELKRFKIVKYEDLVENPGEMVKALAEFLEIKKPKEGFTETVNYSFETVLGSSNRGLTNMNSHSIKRLTSQNIDIISTLAKPMLNRFGYTKPSKTN